MLMTLKQVENKLLEIKKLISSLDFLCYSIIKEHGEFGVAFNNNWLYMCKCSDPAGVDFDSILLHLRLHIIPLGG